MFLFKLFYSNVICFESSNAFEASQTFIVINISWFLYPLNLIKTLSIHNLSKLDNSWTCTPGKQVGHQSYKWSSQSVLYPIAHVHTWVEWKRVYCIQRTLAYYDDRKRTTTDQEHTMSFIKYIWLLWLFLRWIWGRIEIPNNMSSLVSDILIRVKYNQTLSWYI